MQIKHWLAAGVVAAGVAAEWMMNIGLENIEAHEKTIAAELLKMGDIDGVRILADGAQAQAEELDHLGPGLFQRQLPLHVLVTGLGPGEQFVELGLQRIDQAAQRGGCLLIEDDYLGDLDDPRDAPPRLAALAKRYPGVRVVRIHTFSILHPV